nr:hypothetical protein [uncultured Flavobacterium sp.]
MSFKSGDRVFPNASVLEKVNSNIRIELHKSELGNGIVKALVFDGIDEVAVWE